MLAGENAKMPIEYYALQVPGWLKQESHDLAPQMRRELEQLGSEYRNDAGSTAKAFCQAAKPPSTVTFRWMSYWTNLALIVNCTSKSKLT